MKRWLAFLFMLSAVWLLAVMPERKAFAGTITNQGGLVFPANNQTLAYDADGNLSFDGIWTYQWDGENRLVAMTMTNVAGIANSNRLQLQFAYDYLGRRISKAVFNWNGSGFGPNPVRQTTFVYDGWNLLAELGLNNALLRSYTWGNDLSGTMTRAGGVGGLLMANIGGTNCFAAYDGNGNLTALINAADKSLAARYEYSPYGQLIRETGLLAAQIPFRYSTKFWDKESGLVYYGHRYYSPITGRWLIKDLSGEKGGNNLFCFTANNAITHLDSLGDEVNDENYTGAILDDIKNTVYEDAKLPFKEQMIAICADMIYWHSGNYPPGNGFGVYDFKMPHANDTYNCWGYKGLSASKFGNMLAGYSGEFASLVTGNPLYIGGIIGAGLLYMGVDAWDNGGPDQKGATFPQLVSAWYDRYAGMQLGAMDAILDDF